MAVAQLTQHLRQNLEELVVVDVIVRAYLIYIIYVLPVESVSFMLVIEEAVALVDDLPQRLEVALGGVGVFLFIYT